jgi:hypothetical protein
MTTIDEEIAQRAKRLGVPVVPKLPPQPTSTPNPVVSVCGQCGREVHMYESYYCGFASCPVQPRVTL